MDIMIGIVLGLGFQWWTELKEPWQYIAFIFIYISIIDYWIDTSSALKKYPPKKELDLMIDVAIMFTLFLLIYSSLKTIPYLMITFIVFRFFDSFWIVRKIHEHATNMADKHVFNIWLKFNATDILVAGVLITASYNQILTSLYALIIFIIFRVSSRIIASLRYKKIYFA